MDSSEEMSGDASSSTESSSLASMLKHRLRSGLQPTQTKVVLPTGEVSFYQQQGQEKCNNVQFQSSCGYVVDQKPDLTIGQVLPWLFVSSQDVPQDISIVQKLGVTHVLSLLPGFELCAEVRSYIREHRVLELYDEDVFSTEVGSETVRCMPEAIQYITQAKCQGGKVLVHCNAGISRAPTIIMLYLMEKEGYSFDEAWQKVSSVRKGAKPNAGFLNYLRSVK